MVKILVIGDFHGKFPNKLKQEAKKADFILCTGDFGGSDKLLKIIFKYPGRKWWEHISPEKVRKYILEDYNSGRKIISELDKLDKPVFIIPGNWDFTSHSKTERTANLRLELYQRLVKKSKNLHWWNRGIKKVNGFRILAFGGQVVAGDYLKKQKFLSEKQTKKYLFQNKKQTEQLMKHKDKNIDIFLAHYPPYGIFDVVKYKGENPMNGKHTGFKGYRKYIEKYSPKIFVFGHMHEYQGKQFLKNTKIIAIGAAKDGKAVIINIEKDKLIKDIK